jgi:hypothetical protein
MSHGRQAVQARVASFAGVLADVHLPQAIRDPLGKPAGNAQRFGKLAGVKR